VLKSFGLDEKQLKKARESWAAPAKQVIFSFLMSSGRERELVILSESDWA
jgi:hypothetical protein|tara:strand:+ start:94 stop:243 length:150 start_codon:yes stop_codon:yes gene_type:complete